MCLHSEIRRKLSTGSAGQYKLIRWRRKSVGERGVFVMADASFTQQDFLHWFWYRNHAGHSKLNPDFRHIRRKWSQSALSHVCHHCFHRRKQKRTSFFPNFVKSRIEKINSSFWSPMRHAITFPFNQNDLRMMKGSIAGQTVFPFLQKDMLRLADRGIGCYSFFFECIRNGALLLFWTCGNMKFTKEKFCFLSTFYSGTEQRKKNNDISVRVIEYTIRGSSEKYRLITCYVKVKGLNPLFYVFCLFSLLDPHFCLMRQKNSICNFLQFYFKTCNCFAFSIKKSDTVIGNGSILNTRILLFHSKNSIRKLYL